MNDDDDIFYSSFSTAAATTSTRAYLPPPPLLLPNHCANLCKINRTLKRGSLSRSGRGEDRPSYARVDLGTPLRFLPLPASQHEILATTFIQGFFSKWKFRILSRLFWGASDGLSRTSSARTDIRRKERGKFRPSSQEEDANFPTNNHHPLPPIKVAFRIFPSPLPLRGSVSFCGGIPLVFAEWNSPTSFR